MAEMVVSSLRPGYISGHEAVRRIAAVMVGSGIKLQEDGAGFRLIAKVDGRLMIRRDMAAAFNKLSYLQISDLKECLLKKGQVFASCRVTERIVPESGVEWLEGLLAEKGCMLVIQTLKLEPVLGGKRWLRERERNMRLSWKLQLR